MNNCRRRWWTCAWPTVTILQVVGGCGRRGTSFIKLLPTIWGPLLSGALMCVWLVFPWSVWKMANSFHFSQLPKDLADRRPLKVVFASRQAPSPLSVIDLQQHAGGGVQRRRRRKSNIAKAHWAERVLCERRCGLLNYRACIIKVSADRFRCWGGCRFAIGFALIVNVKRFGGSERMSHGKLLKTHF